MTITTFNREGIRLMPEGETRAVLQFLGGFLVLGLPYIRQEYRRLRKREVHERHARSRGARAPRERPPAYA